MRSAALAATTAATGLLYRKLNPAPVEKPKGETLVTVAKSVAENGARDGFTTNEKLTAIEDITNYNNFYEFSTSKQGVAIEAAGFVSRPWDVSVEGLSKQAQDFWIRGAAEISAGGPQFIAYVVSNDGRW